jgi:hypothetical protein
VNLDTFKFLGIGLDKLCIMPKKPELKLSRFIDDAFAVPDAEAELASKSFLELAYASVSLMYKVNYFNGYMLCLLFFIFILFFI